MISVSACLQHRATDQLGPLESARPKASYTVSLRRRPSDLGFDPMVSPTLCPTLSTALKSKFFPLPMVIAAGIGQMMTNCALWRKALSATDKRQQQRVGMAFAGRC